MKNILIVINIIMGLSYSEECNDESGWCYNQSTAQAFYMFEIATINGDELTKGILEPDGTVSCPNNNCDVVAGFNGEVCVGWKIYYINNEPGFNPVFTLPLMGYESNGNGTEGYLLNGQIPTFKFYNTSSGIIIDTESTDVIPPFQNFGWFILDSLNADDSSESLSGIIAPSKLNIDSIYPNPFNSITKLCYTLHQQDNITISIFNLNGNKIESHSLGIKISGYHSWLWNSGAHPSGEYIIQLNSSKSIQNQKIILLK